jgi:hypothetical protein
MVLSSNENVHLKEQLRLHDELMLAANVWSNLA